MTKYSEVVKSILEGLTYAIDRELVEKIHKDLEKEYMLFLTCTNKEEKEQLLKSEIKKIQKKLLNVSPDIAPFLSEYIHPFDPNLGYDDLRTSLVYRFTQMEYVEDVSDVIINRENWTSIEDSKEQEDWFWDAIIMNGEYGLDTKFSNHFIKHMVLANRLNRLLKYNKTNENTPVIENEFNRLLDDLKEKEVTKLEYYQLIKEKTQLDLKALRYLKKDIELFLFSEKLELEGTFSTKQIDTEIKRLTLEKGYSTKDFFKLGIYRKMLIGTEEQKKSYTVDLEKLFYPFEFHNIHELLKMVEREINNPTGVESPKKLIRINNLLKTDTSEEKPQTFKTFVSQEKQDYILKLLEDLSITKEGKSILSQRKKGAIRGIVEALRKTKIIPNIGVMSLCNIIGREIGVELKSNLDASNTSEDYKKDAMQYIDRNPFH